MELSNSVIGHIVQRNLPKLLVQCAKEPTMEIKLHKSLFQLMEECHEIHYV